MKNPRGEEKEGRSETFNIADRLIFSSRERRTATERKLRESCGKRRNRLSEKLAKNLVAKTTEVAD